MTETKVKFTGKVRRGLRLVAQLAKDSFDMDKAPSETVYARWSAAQRSDYVAALRWLEQLDHEGGED